MASESLQTPAFYAEKLREYAKVLGSGNFVDAPAILDNLATDIDARKITGQMIDEGYKQLLNSVWREFCQEPWQSSILNDADTIITKGSPKFIEARRMQDDTIQPQTTCN
jgi:hypothetical protein